MEGFNFELGPRASGTFARTMKELERYLGARYSDSFHLSIITETNATFPDPEMPNITDLGAERPKTDREMTYLEKEYQ